jgi:hypothetical protein
MRSRSPSVLIITLQHQNPPPSEFTNFVHSLGRLPNVKNVSDGSRVTGLKRTVSATETKSSDEFQMSAPTTEFFFCKNSLHLYIMQERAFYSIDLCDSCCLNAYLILITSLLC